MAAHAEPDNCIIAVPCRTRLFHHYSTHAEPGNFIITVPCLCCNGHSAVQVHADFSAINMTHHINHLRFGPQYPGRVNPLDSFDRVVDHDYGTFRYFLTIVPTQYVSIFWSRIETFSFSVTEYFMPGSAKGGSNPHEVNLEVMPSLEFRLSMSPIAVKVWYPNRGVGHVLVRLCAVLGGCFALTQWVDKVVHSVVRMLS